MITNPVAVFDSGIGSLSIIRELRKEMPNEDLLYFADRSHFPYGTKSRAELYVTVSESVKYLGRYRPKMVVIASVTPSVQILHELRALVNIPLIGVSPPLKEASRITKKKHIGIMATEATIRSKEFQNQILREIPQKILVSKFNASPIIELIEDGTFLNNERVTFDRISQTLGHDVDTKIDVMALSSTHLPFVKNYFVSLFPTVKFIDPANIVAKNVKKFLIFNKMLKRQGNGRLQILVSGYTKDFENAIRKLGVKGDVKGVHLSF